MYSLLFLALTSGPCANGVCHQPVTKVEKEKTKVVKVETQRPRLFKRLFKR
jgi:hypothetical protein